MIPIEDSAYEQLQSYIESLRRYFAREEGRDEIINDIESRIAELMSDKVRKGSAAITDADIAEIIASMGRPEDFDAETVETAETSSQSSKQQYTYTEPGPRKRLYRDTNDKFLGGVCSGIAHYFNTDPTIVRILFAVIAFGGGVGILAYILLWIFLPKSDLQHGYSGKRLYRNPDDKMIGGVAGGLAAYFNVRVSTLRLIFAAPLLLSILISIINRFTWHTEYGIVFPNIFFGSLSGTFFLVYIVLWMVLPEARSNYEKMEMRGEKVDVNTIRQNVQEGMGNVKDRVKQWGEEVKESAENLGNKAKEFASTRGKTFAKEVNETTRIRRGGIGHAIGVLFKVFFLFIAGTIAFGLFIAVMALIFGGIAWWPINDFLWTSKWQQAYAWGTLIFFLLVPLVGFIIWVVRRVLGMRSRRSYLGWTFGFFWTVGWVCAILLAASISRDFSVYDESTVVTVPVSQPKNGRMVVLVSERPLEYNGSLNWFDDDMQGWDLSGDTGRLSTVKFNIVQSRDSTYSVSLRKSSRGRTSTDAMERAAKIVYHVTSIDSILDLGNGYTIDKESKFRGQQVEVEIAIPVGKRIRFDRSIIEKLNPTNFRRSHTTYRTVVNGHVVTEYSEVHFRYRTDIDYTMGPNGILIDPTGKTVTDNNHYRYNDDSAESADTLKSTEQQLQELKQKKEQNKKDLEDNDRQIKELEKKQKEKNKSIGMRETLDNINESIVVKRSGPVFSLSSTFF